MTRAAPRPSSAYGEAYADVYAEWYPMADDTEHAVALLGSFAAGAPVLELGVGTGRIAARLAASGLEVWGLDSSPAMLAALASTPEGRAVRAVRGDMTTLPLPPDAPRFGVVFAAFNTLLCLPDPASQLACLRRGAAALAPGGRLVLELLVPAPPPPSLRQLELARVEAHRVVLKASEWLVGESAVHGHHIDIGHDGVRLRPWRLQLLTCAALDELARAAGLALVDRFGDWERRPFTPCSGRHVSVFAVA